KLPVIAISAVIASLLLASGCSAESDSGVPAESAAAAREKAAAATYQRVVIDTDAGAFWFEPTRCSIFEEEGHRLYDIAGPGQSPVRQPVFCTISDAPHEPGSGADVRIHVGVDAPFKHGDPAWISNDEQSHSLGVPASQTTIDGEVLTTSGVVFGKDYGGQLVVTGPIRVDCNR